MKNKPTSNKNFETPDLYLASAITLLLKTPPAFRVEKGITLFVFSASDDLYKAINDFYNGIPLNAYEYSTVIKRLRAEMLIRRSYEAGGNNTSFSPIN